MPVRVSLDLTLTVSSDSREQKDLGNHSTRIKSDGYKEGGSQRTIIAAGVTDKLIPLDDIANVGFVFLKTAPVDENLDGQTVGVRFNDPGNELRDIVPLAGKKVGYYFQSTDALTALYFTNTSAVDIALTMIIAGD